MFPSWPRPRWIVPLFALPMLMPLGCSSVARQPNSPAREIRYTALNDQVPTGDRYFLLVFGSQTIPKLPQYTHTWVTFVRVPAESSEIEQHTISWMPATLKIRTFSQVIEPGVNLDLDQSIKMAKGYNERISLWGPYEIPSGLYRKLVIQKRYIESGKIGYQCIDTTGEAALTGDGSNCVHAISDADATLSRVAYPLTFFGEAASHNILRQLVERDVIKDVKTTHDFLMPKLGLDRHEIMRREYNPPLVPGPLRFGQFVGIIDYGPP